jgi:uncharacterized membrane protein YraQ (UPF0718 family)
MSTDPGSASIRSVAGRPAPRTATRSTAAAILFLLLFLATATRLVDPERFEWVQTFFVIFGSLLIQALPFVLLGALASAAIEVFVPVGTLERLAELPRPLQLPAAALAGLAFPICECGSVPVARRLMLKGLAPSAAVTFMLAAPVLNPVVIASTFVAFRGRSALWTMVLGRFAIGLLVAMAVGWVIGERSRDEILRPRPDDDVAEPLEVERPDPKWKTFFVHLGNDFLFMGRFLLLGATIAAVVQTFLPASIVDGVARLPVVSLLVMMGLAFVLSLCSESDAFIAASFTQFGAASQLAFLVFGPMVDFKLAALYLGTFRRWFFITLLIVVAATTLVATMWVSVMTG